MYIFIYSHLYITFLFSIYQSTPAFSFGQEHKLSYPPLHQSVPHHSMSYTTMFHKAHQINLPCVW